MDRIWLTGHIPSVVNGIASRLANELGRSVYVVLSISPRDAKLQDVPNAYTAYPVDPENSDPRSRDIEWSEIVGSGKIQTIWIHSDDPRPMTTDWYAFEDRAPDLRAYLEGHTRLETVFDDGDPGRLFNTVQGLIRIPAHADEVPAVA